MTRLAYDWCGSPLMIALDELALTPTLWSKRTYARVGVVRGSTAVLACARGVAPLVRNRHGTRGSPGQPW
jgi:hypothetical protein